MTVLASVTRERVSSEPSLRLTLAKLRSVEPCATEHDVGGAGQWRRRGNRTRTPSGGFLGCNGERTTGSGRRFSRAAVAAVLERRALPASTEHTKAAVQVPTIDRGHVDTEIDPTENAVTNALSAPVGESHSGVITSGSFETSGS